MRYGGPEIWSMETWECETWMYGGKEAWRLGDVVARNLETREHRSWLYGSMDMEERGHRARDTEARSMEALKYGT